MKFFKSVYSCITKLKSYSNVLLTFNTKSVLKCHKKMEIPDLMPPSSVRNMTSLDKAAFTKVIEVPSITIHKDHLRNIIGQSKKSCLISSKYLLKLRKFNPIEIPSGNEEARCILLNPALIRSQKDVETVMGVDLGKINGKFSVTEVTVNYENWKADQVLRSVLPENFSNLSGFSVIGHILHLNLREHLFPYKKLIGQVYLDKTPNISLVVNKSDIIENSDNTFRIFSMEKLAGETDNTVTTVKENKCTFTFDFSKVYWNPRLCTEHERIIKGLKEGDVLFDVMAGVGPFAIPAAKKRCSVFANDLNPSSYEALKKNCSLNKITDRIECFNMDGKEFIKKIIKNSLRDIISESFSGCIHVTMNLPSMAVDFLPSFIGLYNSESTPNFTESENNEKTKLPLIHVYLFSFNETKEFAVHSVASKLGYCLKEMKFSGHVKMIDTEIINKNIHPKFWGYIKEVINVRHVAPAKIMFRVSFYLPLEVLIRSTGESDLELQPCKKLKVYL